MPKLYIDYMSKYWYMFPVFSVLSTFGQPLFIAAAGCLRLRQLICRNCSPTITRPTLGGRYVGQLEARTVVQGTPGSAAAPPSSRSFSFFPPASLQYAREGPSGLCVLLTQAVNVCTITWSTCTLPFHTEQ